MDTFSRKTFSVYSRMTVEELVVDEAFIQWVWTEEDHEIFWKGLLESSLEQRQKMLDAKGIVLSFEFKEDKIPEDLKRSIWQNIEAESEKLKGKGEAGINLRLSRWLMAASVLLLLGVVGLFYFIYQNSSKIAISTGLGALRKITLPDSTTVMLNGNSEIQYPKNWKSREVWVKGEVFFDVKHLSNEAANNPFIVHADPLDIVILGTAFNVYARHSEITIVLESGRVALRNHKGETFGQMSQGEKVVFNKESGHLVREKVNPAFYTSWKEGIIEFDKTPVSSIKGILEDIYGLHMIVKDTGLLSLTVTGAIETGNRDSLLHSLSDLLYMDFQLRNDSLFVQPKVAP